MPSKLLLFVFILFNCALAQNRPEEIIYLHPQEKSEYISPQSKLLIKVADQFVSELQKESFDISLKGKKSGSISHNSTISGNTFILQPNKHFQENDTIFVNLYSGFSNKTYSYYFITGNHPQQLTEMPPNQVNQNLSDYSTTSENSIRVINGVSVPSDFPLWNVDIHESQSTDEKIFIAPQTGPKYALLFNEDGSPYAYKKLNINTVDFKRQPDGTITMWNIGEYYSSSHFVSLDEELNTLGSYYAANGFVVDSHDFLLLENGHYIVIARNDRITDMSKIIQGGNSRVHVTDAHIQEFDAQKNLVFEWLCTDHINIQDAIYEDMTANTIDYMHTNSVAVDYDGHIIISIRNQCEVTKIHRQTGELIWRFSGVNNQFQYEPGDTGVFYQHSAFPVEGKPNHYIIFDNGNHRLPRYSRAVEFFLDPETMEAENIWEYRHDPNIYAYSRGNVQRLDNGNTLVNFSHPTWPKAVEVTPDGEVVYEADFEESYLTYRTFKFQYDHIYEKPYLLVESKPHVVSLIFNKFGDTTVAHYDVYAGKNMYELSKLASTEKPYLQLTNLENNQTYFFKVIAVDNDGNESEPSEIVSTKVRYIDIGENYLRNGDFSDGTEHWDFLTTDNVIASSFTRDEQLNIKISVGSTNKTDIKLSQDNLILLKNREYILEFDASANKNLIIEPRIIGSDDKAEPYAQIGNQIISTQSKQYQFPFTMESASDFDATVIFNCGMAEGTIFLDNIKLYEKETTSVEDDFSSPQEYRLFSNFPNPFNPSTTIKYSLPKMSNVKIEIYSSTGELLKTLASGVQNKGIHSKTFNSGNLPSGVYFYKMEANAIDDNENFSDTGKMILIK